MAPDAKAAKSGEMAWSNPKEKAKSTGAPSARSGHSLACAKEKAYLFGGCGIEDGAAAVFNDMWMLHITDSFRWEKIDAMGDVPSPRWRHTTTLLPSNTELFVFGGLCRVRLRTRAPPRAAAPPGEKTPRLRSPAARSALPAPSLTRRVASRAQGKRFNDTYIYDVTRREWRLADIAGTPPHPRSHHTANLVEFDEEEDGDAEKKIFIIGG